MLSSSRGRVVSAITLFGFLSTLIAFAAQYTEYDVAKITDQDLLLKIALGNNEYRAQIEVVNRIADQTLLARIATKSKEYGVRIAAVEKLNAAQWPDLVASIAQQDENDFVRIAAIHKMDAQAHGSLLADIARKAANSGMRRASVERMTDQELTYDIATQDSSLEVRVAAVKALTDQRLLEALTHSGEEEIRCELAKKPVKKEWLIQMASGDSSEKVRLAAVGNAELDDHQVLSRIVANDASAYVREAADIKIWLLADEIVKFYGRLGLDYLYYPRVRLYKSTDGKDTLASIATVSKELRIFASDRTIYQGTWWKEPIGDDTETFLSSDLHRTIDLWVDRSEIAQALLKPLDQNSLCNIAKNQRNALMMRRTAVGFIDDLEFLASIESSDPDESMRKDAIERSNKVLASADQATLASIVANKESSQWDSLEALEYIKDQNLLVQIAQSSGMWRLRQEAVKKLDAAKWQDILALIARTDSDGSVREEAVKKIDPVKNLDLLLDLAEHDEYWTIRQLAKDIVAGTRK